MSEQIGRHHGDCFLVPGPVRMTAATLEAMATPTMTARGPEFRNIMAVLNQRLRIAFNLSPSTPESGANSWTGEDGYGVIVVSGSGTAAMEMVLANRFSKSDKILVPTNGKFGERVAQMGVRFADCTHLEGEWGRSFDLQEIEEHLSTGEYDALMICHNETSTGITQDAPALAILAENHGVAFILDGITSVAGLPVHPEDWNAEAVVVGAQKCTAGPSGIAAIAVSKSFIESCKELRQSGKGNPLYYFDLLPAVKKAEDDQTPWTPAINLVLGWATALSELENETLEGRVRRCALMSQGVRNLFSDLGFNLFAEAGCYSDTVTAILYPEGFDDGWRTRLQNEYQTFVIGAQDHMKGKMFRIGSMGNTSVAEMVEGCRRMLSCFADLGLDLGEVDVDSYFK